MKIRSERTRYARSTQKPVKRAVLTENLSGRLAQAVNGKPVKLSTLVNRESRTRSISADSELS